MLGQFVDDFDARQIARGLRLPRGLAGATTSSFASSSKASTTLSASLNSTNLGLAGLTACSDFPPNKRLRRSAFFSSR